jgi:hypothetical protein
MPIQNVVLKERAETSGRALAPRPAEQHGQRPPHEECLERSFGSAFALSTLRFWDRSKKKKWKNGGGKKTNVRKLVLLHSAPNNCEKSQALKSLTAMQTRTFGRAAGTKYTTRRAA